MELVNIVVLEDNAIDSLKIKMMLSEHTRLYQYQIIELFESLPPLLSFLENHRIDLIVSDIFIKNQPAGLDLLKHLKHTTIPVVLMTSSQQKEVFESVQKEQSVYYLIKPFHAFTLLSTLDKVMEERKRNQQHDFLNHQYFYLTGKGGHREQVLFEAIIHISSEGNYCFVHTSEKKYALKKSLTQLLSELGQGFIRIHQQYIIQKKYLKAVTPTTVELKNGASFPIGKHFRKGLIAYLKSSSLTYSTQ